MPHVKNRPHLLHLFLIRSLTTNTTDVIILYVTRYCICSISTRYVASITGVLLYCIKCLIFVSPVDIMCGTKAKLHLVSFKSKHTAFFLLSFYLFPAVITYTIYDICIIAVTATFFAFKHSLLPLLSVNSHYFYYAIKKKHHM